MRAIFGFDSCKCFRTAAVAGTALLIASGTAEATLVPITNADFETDLAPDSNGFNPAKTGWGNPFDGFGIRQSGSFDPGADIINVPSSAIFAGENNFLQLKSESNPGGPLGGVSFVGGLQAVPTTIQANTFYTLSVQVASVLGTPFPTNIPANDTYPAGFNGGNPIAFSRLIDTAGNGLGQSAGVTIVSNTAGPVAPNTVSTWTIVYQTNAAPANLGSALSIQLFVQSNTAGGIQEALFDNVTLDVSPVPEPATAGLLIAGAALLASRRSRRAR